MQNLAQLLRRAQENHGAGRLAAAIPLYEQVVRADPRSFAAQYYLGIAYYQAGHAARSLGPLKSAAALRPDAIEAHKDLGLILLKLGEFREAEASLARAIALNPGNSELQVNRGVALRGLGRTADAVACYRHALSLNPAFAEAHQRLGNALLSLERGDEALSAFSRAAELKPGSGEVWLGQGQALLLLERAGEALAALQRAAELLPRSPEPRHARGIALLRLGQREQALASFADALMIEPAYAPSLAAQGTVFEQEGALQDALASYDGALRAEPQLIEALLGKAGVLRRLERLDEAIALYDMVIARGPDRAEAYQGIGLAFFHKREFAAAARSFDEAIARNGKLAALHYFRAKSLREIGFGTEALSSLDAAIALDETYVEAYLLKARLLSERQQPEEAIATLKLAQRFGASEDVTFGMLFGEKIRSGDWSAYEPDVEEILRRIGRGEEVIDPFLSLAHVVSPADQLRCAEIYAEGIMRECLPYRAMDITECDGRIGIAYVSGDFRDHAMMYLMAELFERHDRSRFRIEAFSLKKDGDSAMRRRVMPLFDSFHDVDEMSDREILALARRREIDIAVDLMGYTRFGRPSLFAAGLAPLQVNYLGYPGTTGMKHMDYIIADPVLIPDEQRPYYSEKPAYLPNSYQPNDWRREIAEKQFTREELGLPSTGFVYCCFNNGFKITPAVFASWMRILRQVPGSVLWLLAYSAAVQKNLAQAAEAHGVSGERLIFAELTDTPSHLARQRAADLFLDTLPYNAHTTCSDALWAGLPVLTRMGESFASRVAASVLTAAGLPDMIAGSEEEFERLAVMFAETPGALAGIKAKLNTNRMSCALFDAPRYARDLETLFTRMLERHRAGLPPDMLFP